MSLYLFAIATFLDGWQLLTQSSSTGAAQLRSGADPSCSNAACSSLS